MDLYQCVLFIDMEVLMNSENWLTLLMVLVWQFCSMLSIAMRARMSRTASTCGMGARLDIFTPERGETTPYGTAGFLTTPCGRLLGTGWLRNFFQTCEWIVSNSQIGWFRFHLSGRLFKISECSKSQNCYFKFSTQSNCVLRFLLSNLRMWLEDFGFDGFRSGLD